MGLDVDGELVFCATDMAWSAPLESLRCKAETVAFKLFADAVKNPNLLFGASTIPSRKLSTD